MINKTISFFVSLSTLDKHNLVLTEIFFVCNERLYNKVILFYLNQKVKILTNYKYMRARRSLR